MPKSLSVLIIDGESNHALIVARCLSHIKKLQLNVLSKDPWTASRFSLRRLKYIVRPAVESKDEYLGAISKAAKDTGADVILPIDEPAVRFVSLNRKAILDFTSIAPVPDPRIFEIAIDKWAQAVFLSENQLHCPPTILYTGDKTFEEKLSELPFPVLAKPTRGHGGEGIRYFDNRFDVLRFLSNDRRESSLEYIVQSFVHGYDIDCSVLCKDGKILAYTIQKSLFSQTESFTAPSGIVFIKDNNVLDYVSSLVSALKWSGIAHLDLRYDNKDKEIRLIEINPRYWGSLTGSLIVGVNFPYLACLAALNISFPIPAYRNGCFVNHSLAVKEKIQQIYGKNSLKFCLNDTDLGFIASDPIAEFFNMYRRWRSS